MRNKDFLDLPYREQTKLADGGFVPEPDRDGHQRYMGPGVGWVSEDADDIEDDFDWFGEED